MSMEIATATPNAESMVGKRVCVRYTDPHVSPFGVIREARETGTYLVRSDGGFLWIVEPGEFDLVPEHVVAITQGWPSPESFWP